MQPSDTYDALRVVDTLIAKATGMREVARIARTETLLARYMMAEWRQLTSQAADEAHAVIGAGSGPVTEREISRVLNTIDTHMRRWAPRVGPRAAADAAAIYRLARVAGYKKATRQTRESLQYATPPPPLTRVRKVDDDDLDLRLMPAFDLEDRSAIARLREDQMFWIGRHYDENVRETIRTTVRERMLELGEERGKAGAALERIVRSELGYVTLPGGWRGTSARYFEGLAGNAATVARVQGQIGSFRRVGVTRYTISNAVDERTCPICAHMDRKEFLVQNAVTQIEREMSAKNPQDVRNVHPWIGYNAMAALTAKPGRVDAREGGSSLTNAGFSLPPFHFRCRCVVDISEEEFYGDGDAGPAE